MALHYLITEHKGLQTVSAFEGREAVEQAALEWATARKGYVVDESGKKIQAAGAFQVNVGNIIADHEMTAEDRAELGAPMVAGETRTMKPPA